MDCPAITAHDTAWRGVDRLVGSKPAVGNHQPGGDAAEGAAVARQVAAENRGGDHCFGGIVDEDRPALVIGDGCSRVELFSKVALMMCTRVAE